MIELSGGDNYNPKGLGLFSRDLGLLQASQKREYALPRRELGLLLGTSSDTPPIPLEMSPMQSEHPLAEGLPSLLTLHAQLILRSN